MTGRALRNRLHGWVDAASLGGMSDISRTMTEAVDWLVAHWAEPVLVAGTTFSYWTILEIVFWLVLVVIGAVIAAGLCWNFDTRREAGVGSVNVTMGDDDDFNG